MKKIITAAALAVISINCAAQFKEIKEDAVNFADKQLRIMVEETWGTDKEPVYVRTLRNDGSIKPLKIIDWTVGFFPGSLWYMYEFTSDKYWADAAAHFTEGLESDQYYTKNHDLGFMMYCSYGNGYRLTGNEKYKDVIIQSAKSLCTRYRPDAKVIQSWEANPKKDWTCPVIIDNMMNLELLFEASILSGDDCFRKIAINHANTTFKNHFRKDNSSFHVVDYDSVNGKVRHKCTHQGYSDDSAWARGQAWGLYGFTLCYRYTHNKKYLARAEKIAGFIFSHPNMPEDLVPYWDFNAPDIPNAPRDASAAAVIASALVELYGFTGKTDYLDKADKIIASLASEAYRTPLGESHGFLLQHSVTAYPLNSEIDRPLNYADYYWLEAIMRRSKL